MPIYEYQGKHYELSETDPAAAKEKILAAVGTPDTSINVDRAIKRVFGEGTPADMPWVKRAERVGEAGLAGGALGTAIGGVVAGPPGALALAGPGVLAGAATEGVSQVMSATGASRPIQVLAELASGGLANLTVDLAKKFPAAFGMVTKMAAPGLYRTYQAARTMLTGVEPQATKPVQEALKGFQPNLPAAETVGTAIQAGAKEEFSVAKAAAQKAEAADTLLARQKAEAATMQARKEAEMKARAEQARINLEAQTAQRKAQEAAGKEATAAGMRAASAKAQAEQTAQEVRAKEGIPTPLSTEDLGAAIQSDVQTAMSPKYAARSANYDKAYTAAVESAATKESAGQYFAASPQFQETEAYWRGQIKSGKMTEAQSKEIERILNEIKNGRGNQPVKNEWGEITGHTPPEPKTLEGIDAYVRQLGDKAFLEAEGGKAIGVQKAKELRNTLLYGVKGDPEKVAGGLYAWEPKLQEAKALYAHDSEGLKAWRTDKGKAVTAFEQDVKDRSSMAPIDVPSKHFKDRRGFNDLVQELGGDAAKATDYATHHAMKQIEGKSTDQMGKWINDKKQDWMDAVPGLRDKLKRYQSSLAESESKIETAARGASVAETKLTKASAPPKSVVVEPKAVADVKPEPVVPWSKRVDETTQTRLGIAGATDEVTPKNARQVFSDILASKESDAKLRAVGHYISKNPEAVAAVGDAVRGFLSGKSARGTIEAYRTQVLPVLEKTGVVPKAQLTALNEDIAKLERALAQDTTLTPTQKKTKFADGVKDSLRRLGIRTIRSVTMGHSDVGRESK